MSEVIRQIACAEIQGALVRDTKQLSCGDEPWRSMAAD